MNDVAACLEDGYSSAGTSGHGLGAVRRQSSFFDDRIVARASARRVLARIAAGRSAPAALPQVPSWGAVSIPKTGEEVCGDSLEHFRCPPGTHTLMVVDGLGHGPEAADAAVQAVRLFHRYGGHSVPTLLEYLHGGPSFHARGSRLGRTRRYSGRQDCVRGNRQCRGRGRKPGRDAPDGFDGRHRRLFRPQDPGIRLSVFKQVLSSCIRTDWRRAGRLIAIPISLSFIPR